MHIRHGHCKFGATLNGQFSAYLAKYYAAKKGYTVGIVPEAAEFPNACDAVLTRNDGHALPPPTIHP